MSKGPSRPKSMIVKDGNRIAIHTFGYIVENNKWLPTNVMIVINDKGEAFFEGEKIVSSTLVRGVHEKTMICLITENDERVALPFTFFGFVKGQSQLHFKVPLNIPKDY